MKILIITDNIPKQVNGVVTTFNNTIHLLKEHGFTVEVINPELFSYVSLPTYKEIKITINPWKVGKLIEYANPDYIHIATEGPLGLFAGKYCRKKGYKFTTSYHTKMPEYIHTRFPWFKLKWGYKYMKIIHKGTSKILVTTESMKQELINHGFDQEIIVWGRGVDVKQFNTYSDVTLFDKQIYLKPYALYVGRISEEKNLEAFLDLDISLNKVVIGDGPLLDYYRNKYVYSHYVGVDDNHIMSYGTPQSDYSIHFLGEKQGNELAEWYRHASVFVFPSKTDTFGIVMLESMACGTPIAGYPVTGPIDCVENGVTGYLDDDLLTAVQNAIHLNRIVVAFKGHQNTWESCTEVFEKSLVKKK